MQTVTDAYKTAAVATGHVRFPKLKIEVQWNGVDWTDESEYAESSSGTVEASAERAGPSALGATVADSCTITLRNPTVSGAGRFSASNTAGALYANIGGNGGYGKQVRVSIGFRLADLSYEYCQVFIGHLKEPTEQLRPKTISWQAHGWAGRASTTRQSTVLYSNQRADTYLDALRQLIPGVSWATNGQDIGLEYLPVCWADDEPVWGEMVQVAEAEAGRVWFDALGNLRFENYTHLLQHNSSLATLTVASFGNLAPKFDFANIYNHVVVKWRPRYVAGLQNVWQAAEPVSIPANSTTTVWAKMGQPAYDILAPVSGTDWTARTSSYISKTSDLTVTIPAAGAADRYAQRVKLTLVNANTTHQLYTDTLQLRGYPILVTEERVAEAENADSISAYGERVLTVDNVYVQSEAAAVSLAAMLLYRYKTPRQYVDLRGVPGLPYLEIGDRVTVTETHSGINRAFYVVRVGWRFGRSFSQDLTLIEATHIDATDAEFEYTNYFVLGQTALGTVGRAFY